MNANEWYKPLNHHTSPCSQYKPKVTIDGNNYLCVNLSIMKIVFSILFICTIIFSSKAQNDNSPLPSNGIMVTPLMGLVNDQIPSIYYKRYFSHDTASYFNLRIGTESISRINYEYSTGLEMRFTNYNWKLGFERGWYRGNSSFYIGLEMVRTGIKTDGAYLMPEEGALFASGKYVVTESSTLEDGKLRVFSIVSFVGFRHHLNRHFSIGAEAAFGIGWFKSELNSAVISQEHKGRITDFTPVRFISLQYHF